MTGGLHAVLVSAFHTRDSLVPRPFWEGETAWQLPLVQTVYGRNATAIAYLIQSVKSM